MKLVDIGANLTHESFRHDLETVVSSAQAVGLKHICLTGTDLASSLSANRLARENNRFFSNTAGYHPHVATECSDENFNKIKQIASSPETVAIGETGLDFNRNFSPRDQQLMIFEKHLLLAVELQKPVFLHQRDAHHDFLTLLRQYRAELSGGVVHCFTDSRDALEDYLKLDMYIGITGWICDERRGKDLQAMVSDIPLDRLLIETDSPYLMPRTLAPKPKTRRNEPKYLPEVLQMIAAHSRHNVEQIADATSHNAEKLFNITISTN